VRRKELIPPRRLVVLLPGHPVVPQEVVEFHGLRADSKIIK